MNFDGSSMTAGAFVYYSGLTLMAVLLRGSLCITVLAYVCGTEIISDEARLKKVQSSVHTPPPPPTLPKPSLNPLPARPSISRSKSGQACRDQPVSEHTLA